MPPEADIASSPQLDARVRDVLRRHQISVRSCNESLVEELVLLFLRQDPASVSAVEIIARANGWRPKSEWIGPTDNWSSAEEFVRTLTVQRQKYRDLYRNRKWRA